MKFCFDFVCFDSVFLMDFFLFRELSEKVVAGFRPVIPPEWPSVVSRIMLLCWAEEPAKRPSMEHVCSMMSQFVGKEYEELQKMVSTTNTSIKIQTTIVSKQVHSQVLKDAATAAQLKQTGSAAGWSDGNIRKKRRGKNRNYSILSPRRFAKF